MDQFLVIRQPTDQGVFVEEGLLLGRLPLEQRAKGAQAITAVRDGDGTSLFEVRNRVLLGQTQQPLEDTNAFDLTGRDDTLAPAGGVWPQELNPPQHPG